MSRDTSHTFLRTRNFYGGKHTYTMHVIYVILYNICSSIKVSKVMFDISADFSRFNVRDSFFKYEIHSL